MQEQNNEKSMDCNICIEKYNSGIRCMVTCPIPSCGYDACESCICIYLLGSSSTNPKCMMCKNDWSFEFLSEITPASFHNNEYRAYRAKIVREREESLMPTTQNLVQEVINKRNIRKEIDRLRLENDMLKEMIKKNDEILYNTRIDMIDNKNIEEYDLYLKQVEPRSAFCIYSKKYRSKVKDKIKNKNKKLTRRQEKELVTFKLKKMWENVSSDRREKYKQNEVEELYKFKDWVKRRLNNNLNITGIHHKYIEL